MQSYRNGNQIENDCLLERAFIYADGVFETMRCRRQAIPLWSYHRQRLEKAKRQLNLNIDFSELEKQLAGVLQDVNVDDATVKLIVGRGGEARGSYTPKAKSVVFYFSVRPLKPRNTEGGVRLKTVGEALRDTGQLAGLKLVSRLDYVAATSEMHFDIDEEALFFDQEKNVIETMHHNIFAVINSKLVTPDLSRCGVAGIMRECVMQTLAKKLGIDVVERKMSLRELTDAEGVFLTNAIEGIVKVSRIDSTTISDCDLTDRLHHAFNELFA